MLRFFLKTDWHINLKEKIMQKEIIFKIEEFFDREVFSNTTQLIETFDGFSIITNRQEIILAISNKQQCCEDAGYFMTNDNVEDFLNSELLSIDFVDGELKTHTMKTTETITYQDGHNHSFEREGYFVDIKKIMKLVQVKTMLCL